jgi:putative restriction endonuclease
MNYFFYNTDNNDPSLKDANRRFRVLIKRGIAATSGPIKFGKQLSHLKVGDILLMYENQTGIVAFGTVLRPWDHKSHSPVYYLGRFDHEYRIDVDWFRNLSKKPICLTELRVHLGSPRFTPRGALTKIVKGRPCIERMITDVSLDEDLRAIHVQKVSSTTKERLITARLGQGKFRDDVLRQWEGSCAVTSSAIQTAIRASHIKPWSQSTNEERLDPNNGLPLIANLDALFDAGLISFDAKGRLLVSPALSVADRRVFGLVGEKSLKHKLTKATSQYLAHHRSKHGFD